MAWTVGYFFVEADASVRMRFDWDGHYAGVQFALARPVNELFGPLLPVKGNWELQASEHGIGVQPRSASATYSDFWFYSVRVRNASPTVAAVFRLTGGEVAP